MTVCAALLRGINVGGHRIIKMAELRALCTALGYDAVRTLLQSGNVVFRAADDDPSAVGVTLGAAIEERFGFAVDVMVRTAGDLRAVIDHCPFPQAAANDPKRLVATFLAHEADPKAVAELQAGQAGPEQIAPGPGALYIHYPQGIGRSKLTNAVVEKRLGVRGTARNWKTVTAEHDMVIEAADR